MYACICECVLPHYIYVSIENFKELTLESATRVSTLKIQHIEAVGSQKFCLGVQYGGFVLNALALFYFCQIKRKNSILSRV